MDGGVLARIVTVVRMRGSVILSFRLVFFDGDSSTHEGMGYFLF